ncbi:hypothetical protein HYQ45_018502 [Verticillium longisporum]|uniref:Uncharacterized protein n=1 Tax=Verticillium longisporum TaxID=100787 RepID=A0A8I2Z040_VERLO|nr:hypothetical protein HYQ45_018502 [Verticillium longisporum]
MWHRVKLGVNLALETCFAYPRARIEASCTAHLTLSALRSVSCDNDVSFSLALPASHCVIIRALHLRDPSTLRL